MLLLNLALEYQFPIQFWKLANKNKINFLFYPYRGDPLWHTVLNKNTNVFMCRLLLGCNPNIISNKEAEEKGEITFLNMIEKHSQQ